MLGYLNGTLTNGVKNLVPDPERAELVRKAPYVRVGEEQQGSAVRFYFCAWNGCRAVSARKEDIESDWLNLRGMMQPTMEGVNQVAEAPAARWQHRKVRAEEERRQVNTRLIEQHTLNKQTIEARVKGKISDEDFATMKAAIAAEVESIEQGLKRLEDERTGMQELIKNTEVRLSNLATWWRDANLQDRVELQFSLWPDGLSWTHERMLLNTANRSLFQQVREMLDDMVKNGGRQRT